MRRRSQDRTTAPSPRLAETHRDSLRFAEIRRDSPRFPRVGVLAGLVETLLLARCSALVGKFSSGLFRLAYALSAAHKGGLPPYLSLDAPWCVDYGLPAVFNDEFPSRGPGADADGGGHGGGAATEQVVVTTAQAPGGRFRGGEARGVVRRPFSNVCPC